MLYGFTVNEPQHCVAYFINPPRKYDGTKKERVTPVRNIDEEKFNNISNVVYILIDM